MPASVTTIQVVIAHRHRNYPWKRPAMAQSPPSPEQFSMLMLLKSYVWLVIRQASFHNLTNIRASIMLPLSGIFSKSYLVSCNYYVLNAQELSDHFMCYFHATDSGSARFKADLKARTVQARVAAGSTSQSVLGLGGPYIYNEPNKKSSVFIGNLTWVNYGGL